jgi:hypothetical protein
MDLKVVLYQRSDHIVFAAYELHAGIFFFYLRKMFSLDCSMLFISKSKFLPCPEHAGNDLRLDLRKKI